MANRSEAAEVDDAQSYVVKPGALNKDDSKRSVDQYSYGADSDISRVVLPVKLADQQRTLHTKSDMSIVVMPQAD